MSTPSTPIQTLNALWDEFLARWPLETLRSMSLEAYSQAGNKDCFTYWLESRTEDLGSIWGGSAFKFGVYSRRDLSDKTANTNSTLAFSPTHGWLSKYGATAEQAFERVRGILAEVASAAREGRLDAVDAADLGHATKWKIAFLYQDRDHPQVLPIFKRAVLDALPGVRAKDSTAQGMRQLIERMPAEQTLLGYGQALWVQAEELVEASVSSDEVLAYLEAYPGLTPIKPPTQKHAGFRLRDGRELCLMRERKTPVIYMQPGPWSDDLPKTPGLYSLKGPDDTRSHGLDANAPSLAAPHPAASFATPSQDFLLDLMEAYTGETAPPWQAPQGADKASDGSQRVTGALASFPIQPLNQILYGPPGTGKTYSTINAALEILDPTFLAANLDDRKALKDRFDTFERERRVRFVTFHQSFSYEDFVEGIRAGTGDKAEGASLSYAVERGVFGALCADAARNIEADLRMGVRADATVWKISISEANSKDNTRQYCFDHGEARIGWENVGDVLQTKLADPALQLGPKDQASLQNFAHEMQIGDVVLCLGSKTSVRAVGVVAGAYEYEPAVPTGVRADYVHRRAVRWLNTQLDFDITALNGGKQLTLQTVYPLSRIEWPQLEAALRLAGGLPESGTGAQASEKPPYVLVIDEINRGNISRIFGELITLIEPSKRAGADEALQVLLPYSKKLFSVPQNVYLIGTMNTADRSLTGMDVALRRRFVFKEMPPRPDLLDKVLVDGVIPMGQLLRVLNQRIEALLDRDHCLGHANFMPLRETPTVDGLAQIFRNQILPLLQEYFFDDWQRIQWVLNDHRKPAELRFVNSAVVDTARLFGRDAEVNVAGGAKTWTINEAAFLETESYLATLGPPDGSAEEA